MPVKDKKVQNTWLPLHRLVVAQDTGSAIKGPIRADIFFGHGDKAVYLANNTSFPGRYYVLIPTSMINQIEVKK